MEDHEIEFFSTAFGAKYYSYMMSHSNSLLCRFYGVYRFEFHEPKSQVSINKAILVMQNLSYRYTTAQPTRRSHPASKEVPMEDLTGGPFSYLKFDLKGARDEGTLTATAAAADKC
eukprot:CAMPEP_0177685574 /NCGR_PEP_ID=MMETSP0447-20121125/33107_1 /TAXON_ID=0 /ORGANISM="Stygamoeba regulata, Strain BSH-02190019" /LENGTH=115 /DNA_ID=CAMNT_0019195637 /DNA_START=23 /DNA_END=370 /DNA_ORIENTATION=-